MRCEKGTMSESRQRFENAASLPVAARHQAQEEGLGLQGGPLGWQAGKARLADGKMKLFHVSRCCGWQDSQLEMASGSRLNPGVVLRKLRCALRKI